MVQCVHFPCGLVDQQAQHFALSGQFDQRELNSLVLRQFFPKRLSLSRIAYALFDAELGCAEAACRLADTVLVHEALRQCQTAAFPAEDGAVRDPNPFYR